MARTNYIPSILSFLFSSKGISNKQVSDLVEELRSMRKSFTEGGRIGFREMLTIPFAKDRKGYFEIAPGVKAFRLTLPGQNFILFECYFEPSTSLGIHDHDCVEWTWITDGEAIVDGEVKRPYDLCQFEAEQEHLFETKVGCRLIVAFHTPISEEEEISPFPTSLKS